MDEFEVIAGFLPPFLSKTYNMVDESSTDSIVSWSSGNKSFIVWNPPEFARDLLPKYFKHNNFSSFIRQLNTYGFRKIDPEKWEFANDDFVRGQPQLMKNIHRRKPVHSHSLPNIQVQAAEGSCSSLSEGERRSMKDEIERLNREKECLAVELERHEQERQGMELQMRFLEDRVQHMQRQQQSLVALLARVLQRPELASNPVPQLELRDRKRRFSSVGRAYDDVNIGNGQMGSSRENMEMGKVLQLESFVRFWEDAILDIGDTDLQARTNLELAESTRFVEIDMNSEPAAAARSVSTEPARTRSVSLEPARSVSFDPARSVSPEPARSASLEPARSVSLEPPRRFSPEPARSVSLELDIRVSLEPAKSVSSETHVSKQTSKEQTAKLSGAGVNDVFWEQFLTEIPGSNESQEVQLERKDSDDRGNKSNISERSKSWLNMRNVNNLTEQMGHLSSVEKT